MSIVSPFERTERLQLALGALERLVASLCLHPEGLETRADHRNDSVELEFTAANLTDAKRITGGGRMSALNVLACMMQRQAGKTIRIAPVERSDDSEDGFERFELRRDWPADRFAALAKDCAEACGLEPVAVEQKRGERQTTFKVVVPKESGKALEFGKHMTKLLFFAASRFGQRAFVDMVDERWWRRAR